MLYAESILSVVGLCGYLSLCLLYFGLRVTTNFTVVLIVKCTIMLCTVFLQSFSIIFKFSLCKQEKTMAS